MSSSPAPMTVGSSVVSTAGPSTPSAVETLLDLPESSKPAPTTPPRAQTPSDPETPSATQRYARLQFLLKQSSIYSTIMHDVMHRKSAKETQKEARAEKKEMKRTVEGKGTKAVGKKRSRKEFEEEKHALDAVEATEDAPQPAEDSPDIEQPSTITGATLRDYQLAGLQWLVSLHSNGLNGILADEMGLGKTLQVIALIAHLKEHSVWGPYLIVCPLSVMHNWVSEFEKFAPSIPVLMYHGSKAERAELQKLSFSSPSTGPPPPPKRQKGSKKGRRSSARPAGTDDTEAKHFPVVVTTYEMIIRDKVFLSSFEWKHLIVDEGHRLKNMESRLIKEIKQYRSLNRLILTGTPLHNNLAELWSLLNFILPDIFDDLDAFQQWFNFDEFTTSADASAETLSQEQTAHVVSALHDILKPFLLRRLKSDVEVSLPPKKEYVLYAPLTQMQSEVYKAVVGNDLRNWLIERKVEAAAGKGRDGSGTSTPVTKEEDKEESKEGKRRKLRRRRRVTYNDDGWSDGESGGSDFEEKPRQVQEDKTAEELGLEWMLSKARKVVGSMNLQNRVMQLRKVSSHPYLFDWPVDPVTGQQVVNEQLVGASGKMLLLDRLLDALFAGKHKVLLFSQFTTMLDIIEDWARFYKGWDICRIDGSTAPTDRRAEMDRFNNGGDAEDAVKLFLLSTRAGGLGINLVSADTVIFYDQDWNPQMDLQAQDRAHRIGQTKPVLIFRLVTAHTIETKILQRAAEKRKLEALVIAKGKFKAPGSGVKGGKPETYAEIAASLLALEGEKINIVSKGDEIISDKDLEVLLDRSPEVFTQREKGWTAGASVVQSTSTIDGAKHATGVSFEVIETAADEGSERLATMMGESFD